MAIDITVGSVERPLDAGSRPGGPDSSGPVLEARVLSVRRARRAVAGAPGVERRRRRAAQGRDPLGAQVVTLLIAEGNRLPADLVKGPWRPLVRFVKR